MKKWFLYIGLALFIGAFVNCGVVEGGTTKFFSPGFKLWGSYHYLSMSDWNSYKENVNDKQVYPYWDNPLPSFHHGFVVGGEFSCLFMDMWGFGVGTGLISGKGVDYKNTVYVSGLIHEIEYKHSAKAIPLMLTLYYTPRVSLFRFVLGGGGGFYHSRTNFDIDNTYTEWYRNGSLRYYCSSFQKSDLSGNGLGLHGSAGLEIKIPETPISIFVEGRLRYAKISSFEGETNEYSYGEEYDPVYRYKYESWKEDTTYDVELKYREGEYKYFGPVSEEEAMYYGELRDGIIDFSGFEFAIGISFRF